MWCYFSIDGKQAHSSAVHGVQMGGTLKQPWVSSNMLLFFLSMSVSDKLKGAEILNTAATISSVNLSWLCWVKTEERVLNPLADFSYYLSMETCAVPDPQCRDSADSATRRVQVPEGKMEIRHLQNSHVLFRLPARPATDHAGQNTMIVVKL
jgi:hypothetical protein